MTAYDDPQGPLYLGQPLLSLYGLISRMTPGQQFRLKYAFVQQTLHYMEARLPPPSEDDGERGCLMIAQQWLDEPTNEHALWAVYYVGADAMDGGARYDDYSKDFLEPACAAGSDLPEHAASCALRAALPAQLASARQWQIEAALAILEGKELPILA
jgi:hypothetical protein